MTRMNYGLVLACALLAPAGQARALTPDRVVAWREDLEFVRVELPRLHPDPFTELSRTEFDALLGALDGRLGELQPHEVVVELAAIVASIHDGHTRLTLPVVEGSGFFSGHSTTPLPADPTLWMHYLPVRFFAYEEGLFVRRIDREHADVVGARVVRIGTVDVTEAVHRVQRVVHRDNAMQLRGTLPSRLAIPEVLHAVGVTPDPDRVGLELELADHRRLSLVLEPVAEGSSVDWVDIADPPPLPERHAGHKFWFEYLESANAVFCQIDEIGDEEHENFAAFSRRLRELVNARAAAVVILDLRSNRGGNNSLNRSLLRDLMACESIAEPGGLFVLVGRDTFSAAMMLAVDLERLTNAIFVGEPTGARPNHFGDSRRLELPNSGLTLRVSSLYWQYAGPRDEREWLAPQIPVPITAADARRGRDRALDEILELVTAEPAGSIEGRWTGQVLDNEMVLDVRGGKAGWRGTLDLPSSGLSQLPLEFVRFSDDGALECELAVGEDVIRFEGTVHGALLVGRLLERDQSYPWVMIRSD